MTRYQVGTLCAVRFHTDVHACRVIESSEKRIVVQEDFATLLNGADSGEPDALKFEAGGFVGHTSGVQRWKLEPNPHGARYVFTLRKNGRWVAKGDPMNSPSMRLLPEHKHFYDFNF